MDRDAEFWFTIRALAIFLIVWIACIYQYGFLYGGSLGAIPALIIAVLVSAFWVFFLWLLCLAVFILILAAKYGL